MFNIITRTVLSLGFCALAVAPALAEPATDRVSVHLADLNLATPAGQQALHRRLAHAVDTVCPEANSRDLRASSAMHVCRAAAMSKAMLQMQTAIANARTDRGYAANDATASLPAS